MATMRTTRAHRPEPVHHPSSGDGGRPARVSRERAHDRRVPEGGVVPVSATACCAPLAAPVLSAAEAEATAELFKALGDPARVRIVNLLARSEDGHVCACDLLGPLGLSQPTVSHHLKKLLDAGLVER